jgi:hypothetical protein
MEESKFTSYPEDVLKMLLELLKENLDEVDYHHQELSELYPQRSDDLKDALRVSAAQIGETKLELIDYEYLLQLWGLNPNYTEGTILYLPKMKKIVVTTRVNLKQYVREFWDTTYYTYLTESQLQFFLEEYENLYWEGDQTDSQVQDADTIDTDIDDINEEPLTESKYKTKIVEELDNKMNDISYLKKMKNIIENRINYLSKQ